MESTPDEPQQEAEEAQEATPPPAAPEDANPPPPPPPPSSTGWSGGRVVGLVFTSFGALIGIALLVAGIALIALHAFARDDDGFYSVSERLESRGFAVTTDEIDLGTGPADPAPGDILGTLRVSAENTKVGPVFIGIAHTRDLERYLSGVAHSELTGFGGGDPDYDFQPGTAPRTPPGAQDFWVAQSQGPGKQQVDWESESGIWSVAIMNAAATRGVTVTAEAGAEISWLIWVGVGFTVVGLILLAIAVVLIIHLSRRASRDAHAAEGPPAAEST